MELREATHVDVPGILRIRRIAQENELNFDLTEKMLHRAIARHCKAFVIDKDGEIIAFSMADKKAKSIWGLFVWEPFQGQGYGKLLLKVAVDWLFAQRYGFLRRKIQTVTLTTKQGAEAEGFYQKQGWRKVKSLENDEVLYELTKQTLVD